MKISGIIILVIGILLTIFTTFKYFTKEKVIDIGKVEISKEQPHRVAWSPLIGIATMGLGAILLWQDSKRG